jgi:hypothetical protein
MALDEQSCRGGFSFKLFAKSIYRNYVTRNRRAEVLNSGAVFAVVDFRGKITVKQSFSCSEARLCESGFNLGLDSRDTMKDTV